MARLAIFAEVAVVACLCVHLVAAPFTKVEESFQVQAVHDLLEFGPAQLAQFDHLDFGGVVPRSFIGPLLMAAGTWPARCLLSLLGVHKASLLVFSRLLLGLLFAWSYRFLRVSFGDKFARQAGTTTSQVATFAALISCCQFHLLFYATRPLANTFATVLVNVALGYWLRSSYETPKEPLSLTQAAVVQARQRAAGLTVVWLAVACILFRCDMIILSLCVLGASFLHGWLSFRGFLRYGLVASFIAISLTVVVDSFFWRRLLWPELEVLWFNTFAPDKDGRMFAAAEFWGTQPFWWYFAMALPKSLLAATLLLPIAILQRLPTSWRQFRGAPLAFLRLDVEVIKLLSPCFLFLFLYSFLAHKELRFVYPILPLLNCFAALGLAKMRVASDGSQRAVDKHQKEESTSSRPSSNQSPSRWSLALLAYRAAQLGLLLSGVVACVSLVASSWNYPGGYALEQLHRLAGVERCARASADPSSIKPLVHIGNLAATTGASRFGEYGVCWRYEKTEGLLPKDMATRGFDYLISEHAQVPGFEPVRGRDQQDQDEARQVWAFKGMRFEKRPPFLSVERYPALFLLQRAPQAQGTLVSPPLAPA